MSDELHRLCFDYRNARSYPDAVNAYKALEAYETSLLNTIAELRASNTVRLAAEVEAQRQDIDKSMVSLQDLIALVETLRNELNKRMKENG
jgi:hypothetical protein